MRIGGNQHSFPAICWRAENTMRKEDDIYVRMGKIAAKKLEIDPRDGRKPLTEKLITQAVEKAANAVLRKHKSKGITTTEPKDRKASGYELEFTLNSIAKAGKGQKADYKCDMTVVVGTWKKNKPRAKVKMGAKMTPNRIVAGLEAVTEAATKNALSVIVKKLGTP
jgi:uncharacterized protein YifN (PemK superfamily)